jgi:hypothetical protein
MKTLIRVLATALCIASAQAANIVISGTLSWKIFQPDCTFKLDGAIANLSPEGSTSGTLKLILWATPAAFPSRGYALAEHTLGQVDGGYQFTNFSATVPVYMQKITGDLNFTIAVLEYTTAGWLNRAYVSTGKKKVENGDFVTGKPWIIPIKPVIAPPARMFADNKLTLAVTANEDLNAITPGTRAKTRIKLVGKNKATISIAGEDSTSMRKYLVKKSTLYQKKVPVGQLHLDPLETTGSSTVTLFFQSPNSGVFKNVEENHQGGGTFWGTFTFK